MRPFSPAFVALLVASATGSAVEPDWAYKPYTRPAVPAVKAADARSPIDRFLLAKLEAAGRSYSPPADKRTLLRRVTFDLTGLPPTPAEVEAFLKDESPDAYARVVDRLLASPAFGERQALWWLDLVRYAESDGFKADDPRPDAWRYRDYVIRSFNADKPYDRFLMEQLAGDELYPGHADALIATGFLRHYPDEYNAVNLEQRRQEILNDIADTTAAAFLGLTLGCARCHDHKTDPITQADYYRFQAFFAGYWPADVVVGKADGGDGRRAAWEAKTAATRAELAKLEEPYRRKESNRQRGRFSDEYAGILDIPEAKRTPLERQIGAMVGKQVYAPMANPSAGMSLAEKERWRALTAELAELSKDKPADPPRAMAMTDLGREVPPTRLLKRGQWNKPGEELVPGFLSAVDDRDAVCKPTATTSGRRAALAEWVASPKNPLTARAVVNRLWQGHFGRGIVASASDLGVTGDRPTHPELLDWLAAELVEPTPCLRRPDREGGLLPQALPHGRASDKPSGWSLKHVHRLIVTSAAYQQQSGPDTDDGLLSHYPRRRLDGEALRDAMLAAAGLLNPKAGGPGVFPELPAELKAANWKPSAEAAERNRRSVYVAVRRNLRYPLFGLFDSPDRNETCARRFVTTTAPQALTLLNDGIVLSYAKALATRAAKDDPADPAGRAFVLALGRPPSTEEAAKLAAFLDRRAGKPADALADLCHALLNLNEFLYVD
ncbi:MAG: DUF1549 and DUF1553 domain-containing protein [Gemmataceae bacterium]|nr:DUF1549 and DUF1553 domain-containing protein [Gemmataceae bacterium]